MKRVFVAGPWEHRAAAKELMTRIETSRKDLEVTHDWTQEENEDPVHAASLDLVGVQRADCLVVLVPPVGGQGMFIEMGVALERGIPIHCVPLERAADAVPFRTIYQELPGVYAYPDIETMLEEL